METTHYPNIIAGAGPAGLFAALHCGRGTLVVEKNREAGKKLLISGSGRCNITHEGNPAEFYSRYGTATDFVKTVFRQFNNQHLLQWLQKQKFITVTDKNGKVFPKSRQAADVRGLLTQACLRQQVDFRFGNGVSAVERMGNGFRVTAGNDFFTCDRLLITTGGKSYPATGSTGDGYRLAEILGHTVVPPKPSLTPVFTDAFAGSDLAGATLPLLRCSLVRDGKKLTEFRGDVLFTHKGLSGPGILDNSRYMETGDQLLLHLAETGLLILTKNFMEMASGTATVGMFLKPFGLPKSLQAHILQFVQLEAGNRMAETAKAKRTALLTALTAFPVTIDRIGGFSVAMATAGGVSREEVDPKTLESKIVPGLFFAGEVIDVDGDTGGYNLQFAFSSGYVAAQSMVVALPG